jgi:hypothetical protein
MCHKGHTVRVLKSRVKKLRKRGYTLGPCRKRRTTR